MDPQELHAASIVIDTHCDTLLSVLGDKRSLLERSDEGHNDLPRLKEGGVTAQVFALFARPAALGGAVPTWESLRLLDAFYQAMAASPELILATKAGDVRRAKAEGLLAGIIGMEGAEALRGDLGILRLFYRLGLRNLGLTWSLRNEAADGVFEERTGGGLTEFGVQVVRECNRLGIMIDVAHLAPAGVRDVLAMSELPVIDSHANARALCDHRRNLTDQQLEGVAKTGGVVCVVFVPSFVAGQPEERTLGKVLDHIDHIVSVIGADHVGLGSDFDGFDDTPIAGLESGAHFPHITAGLLARGYSEENVRKILGGNVLRVFEQVAG
ncbi:MAG TPA: dipeptidase [Anaerolineae bacterium]|nr:dipeptidase [Anaerolineae bacterium]HOQ99026.1 dipeptidase [Anaerolineae bacterium]HPL27973.1 dipeptidase [Anaerolineae bacterium]